MGTRTFGYGQTYDWSTTHWLYNCHSVNSTTATSYDGWLICHDKVVTTGEAWSSIGANWTETNSAGCDSDIDPAGQLRQRATNGAAADDWTDVYDVNWANAGVGNTTWTLAYFVALDTPSISTATSSAGFRIKHDDGTRKWLINIRSDGNNFDVYVSDSDAGGAYAKRDTLIPIDTRFHSWVLRNNNVDDGLEILCDGKILFSDGARGGVSASAGHVEQRAWWKTGDPATVEHHIFSTYYWDTYTSFSTTSNVQISSTTASAWDAGAGNAWEKIEWTSDESNGTTITAQVRTADTSDDFPASIVDGWTTVTNGEEFSDALKNRVLQVWFTFNTEGSGQYTPILKTATATYGLDYIRALNRRPNLNPYRKVEIKRRLSDATGNYESSWQDVTNDIVQFGNMEWKIDADTMGVFIQSTMTLTGDNTDKQWNDNAFGSSLFSGFATRYKTLFRITTGLIDTDGTIYPTVGTAFYGILSDDIQLTETEAVLIVNSLTSIFREQSAIGLALLNTDKASDMIDKILALTDNNGNIIFNRFLEGNTVTATTVTYKDAAAEVLDDLTCWDLINRLCLAEDYCAFIGTDGYFYFKSKDESIGNKWKFIGADIYEEDYGINISEIKQGNDIWTKVYNQIKIEHTADTFSTVGDTWGQGDGSSSDLYGERDLNITESMLQATEATTLANALYTEYREPKIEVILTSSTFNPLLQLLDKVKVTYYGENTTEPAGIWGYSVWDDTWSDKVGLWTGKKGGIYLKNKEMKIIGITLDLDNFISEFHLREI